MPTPSDAPGKARERRRSRRKYEKRRENPEFRARNVERARRWAQEHPEAAIQHCRNFRMRAHGPMAEEMLAAMWEQQGGCCYLCCEPLEREQAVVDHDHACCRRPKTCAACRRGFACHRCNRLIGAVGDDPDLLRRIAANLDLAIQVTRPLIAAKPVQLEIPEVHDDPRP